ncbi:MULTISPECIES: hypothetical protein [unclassified Nonomuraea]
MDLQVMLTAFGLSAGVVIIVSGMLGWNWLSWVWGHITSRTR